MKLIKNLKFRIIVCSLGLLLGSLAMATMCELSPMSLPQIFNNNSSNQEYFQTSVQTNFSAYAPGKGLYDLVLDNNANANAWVGFDPSPNMPAMFPSGVLMPF